MRHPVLQGRDVGCAHGARGDRLPDPVAPLRPSSPRHPGSPSRFGKEKEKGPGKSFSNTGSNGFYSCNCTRSQNQGMDISELEFVQIIIILLVMTLMTVTIICLLHHYWLPALAFLSRLSHTQRHQATQLVMTSHPNSSLPPFMQQQQLCRLQPTYPYLPQEIINLPPIICLSDGEELLPYKGPCSLQLRHPDQQLELIRAAVRAPPNRTVFDSDLTDSYAYRKSPQAPSSNSGTNNGSVRTEGPPPSYSEVMGDTASYRPYSNNEPATDSSSGHDSSQTVVHIESTTQTSDSDLNS